MSRIGKSPIELPAGVTAQINDSVVTVTGPLGKLERRIDPVITVTIDGNTLHFTRSSEDKNIRAKHGLFRALVHNMVVGVTQGYKKVLTINGVGFKANKQGNKLILNIGYTDPREMEEIDGIKLNVLDANNIEVSGIDKELVGQFSAKIRSLRPVEPYHGYGVRYKDEVVVHKEGKKAATATAGKK